MFHFPKYKRSYFRENIVNFKARKFHFPNYKIFFSIYDFFSKWSFLFFELRLKSASGCPIYNYSAWRHMQFSYIYIVRNFCHVSLRLSNSFSVNLQWLDKVERWETSMGFAAVLSGLSELFDCIPYVIFIAKLSAYSFDKKSLTFMNVY